jgi:PAS domain S-box-containing protein
VRIGGVMKRSLTAQSVATFVVLGVLIIAGFAVMAVAAQNLRTADRQRAQSTTAITTANQLEQSVLDLETGLRGYLLAGNPAFLQPYRAALAAYPAQVATLQRTTAGDADSRSLTTRIAEQIHQYVTGWAAPVIHLAGRNLDAARKAEAAGGGKRRVDTMRAQFSTLIARESAIRSDLVARAGNLATFVLISGIVATVLFVLLIAYVAVRTQTVVVAPLRRLASAVSAITGGDLSARVPEGGAAEVGTLMTGFNRMADGLERQRADLEDHQDELEAQKAALQNALADVEEHNVHIELLRRFGDRLAEAPSLEAVGSEALNGIAHAGRCEIGATYLLDPETDQLIPVAWMSIERNALPPVLVAGEGLAGRALAERHRVCVSYGSTEMHVAGLGRRRDCVHELHLPIVHGEETIGIISVGRLEDRRFSEADLRLLEDLAERTAVDCAQALATRRLRHTAHELGAILETTDEGIYVINTASEVTLVNRAALELTGYSREELVGNDSHALMHHTREDGTPYPAEECPVASSFRTGEGVRRTDEVYWRRDGTSFPVEYSSYPLFEDDEIKGAVVTFMDRTARRIAQRQRDTQHALTRVFAEVPVLDRARPQMLAAVCEGLGFDVGLAWEPGPEDGELRAVTTYAAPRFEDLVERLGGATLSTTGTLAGLAISRREPVHCTDLERDPPRPGLGRDRRLVTGVAFPVISRSGALIAVAELFSARAVSDDGLFDTLRALGTQVGQHIERQRAEEEAQQMKDQIVANVSHELRTPLTAIDGWVQVLLGEEPGPLNADQRRFLGTVKRNSERLMRLVGDLLVAGQIEAGKLSLEFGDVDVSELARETAELVASSAQAKQIVLAVQADEHAVVRGDRQRLGQLLTNLVNNAIKFTPEQGSVIVRITAQNETCRIAVRDTGIGIPPGEREHLFERFYRTSTATARGIKGTGLGLAISKAIAESHEGTLKLGDADGPGTEFVVELPLAIREEVFS